MRVEPVDKTHSEVVATISDAVAELTRRAIAPTLDPFQESLSKNIRRWEDNVQDISNVADELKERQDRTASAVAHLESALHVQASLLEAARARDEALARQLQSLQAQSEANATLLAQSDARRAEVATAISRARLVTITGFGILFATIVGWGLALLHLH
jgi:hypothetical protein